MFLSTVGGDGLMVGGDMNLASLHFNSEHWMSIGTSIIIFAC